MSKFEELKKELLRRAKSNRACADGYRNGMEVKTPEELIEVIATNFHWLVTTKVVDAKMLEDNFTYEQMAAVGIYANIEDKCVHNNNLALRFIGKCDADVTADGFVKAYGDCKLHICGRGHVTAYDNCELEVTGSIHVYAHDHVKVCASNDCYVEGYGYVKAVIHNRVRAEMRGFSNVITFDYTYANLKDSATAVADDESYIVNETLKKVEILNPNVIVKNLSNDTVEVPNGRFKVERPEID
jgi:hypothetical protein